VERCFGQIGILPYALTAKENKRFKTFFSCTKLFKCLLSSIGLIVEMALQMILCRKGNRQLVELEQQVLF